jgi:iron complex outermembrane receptor protein
MKSSLSFVASFAASTAIVTFAAPAIAQGPHHKGTPGADPYHDPKPEIVVTAPFERSRSDLLSGVSVLSGVALSRDIKPTIGDTLAHQPGVSATSFGPNASRPVLRGFQGERVRVLTDGIGSFDVSNTSVDHAVVINPLTADRIEVLRGPSALLFGSGAIGGVVNVIDRRIPRQVPDEDFHIAANATYGSAANERSGGAAVDVPVGTKIVFHVDGSYSKADDLDTGGFILSPSLRAQAAASADPAIAALADLKGKLPNSAGRTWDVAGGAAVITDSGNLGFSVSHYDSLYGVPIRYSLDPAIEAEQVRLDVKQTRADFRAEADIGDGFLSKIRTRWGWADYQHSEIDDTGAIGTTFFNQGIEGRIELVQANRGGWKGAVGGQLFIRDLNIVGDEKFLPKSETQQYGLFTLQEFNLGLIKAEIGGRFEHSILNAAADTTLGNPDLARRFDAFSGSAGASITIIDGWHVGLNLSHTERAPSAEELFANGPHAGTQAFEVGDPDFRKEASNGVEATVRGAGEGYSFEASAYHSWFKDYIYEAQTGAVQDGLPVFQFAQADARYYGFEVQGSLRLAEIGDWKIVTDGLADYVHAKITSAGPAPRIPPLRLLGGIEGQSEALQGRVEVERVMKQDRVAAFETTTGGYTMVNASVSVKPFGEKNPTSIILSANNIFDVEARRHASFLKDFAPLGGRDLRVTARLSF